MRDFAGSVGGKGKLGKITSWLSCLSGTIRHQDRLHLGLAHRLLVPIGPRHHEGFAAGCAVRADARDLPTDPGRFPRVTILFESPSLAELTSRLLHLATYVVRTDWRMLAPPILTLIIQNLQLMRGLKNGERRKWSVRGQGLGMISGVIYRKEKYGGLGEIHRDPAATLGRAYVL